jgi:hypothetical protein
MSLGLWRTIRLLLAVLMVGGMALAATSVSAQDRTEEDASVRFVHASPDAPEVDVLVDGGVIASNVAFGTVSDYMAIPGGEHQLQIVPAGSPAESALIDTTIDLDDGNAYLVAATGLLNEIESKTFEIDLDDTDSGQARIRTINLSPDEGSVDMYVAGGDEITDDTGFGDASDYEDIDAGSYDLELREHDSDAVRIPLAGVSVESGRAYDILALGQAAAGNLTAVALETRVSPACGDVLGIGSDTDACVRVLHASPDASAVDVYVNDTLVVQNLEFGAATEYAALPAGDDMNLKIVPTGSGLDSAVVDTGIELDEGDAYTVIASNKLDDISAKVVEDNLNPLPVDQARITVIHEAPDSPDVDVVVTDGPTLFEGVGFEDVTDGKIVDAGQYDLQLKDGDNVVARAEDVTLDAGMNYDIVAIGSADNNTLQVIVLSSVSAVIEGAAATPSVEGTPESGGMTEVATPDVVSSPGP